MKPDKTGYDVLETGIPGDFRENYRFLSELINCTEKNTNLTDSLSQMPALALSRLRGKLHSRQVKILCEFLTESEECDPEPFQAPVPAELEAAIRVKRRASWLPWEAEAIRKIDRWRKDVKGMLFQWGCSRAERMDRGASGS
jgi:hypothetical protein